MPEEDLDCDLVVPQCRLTFHGRLQFQEIESTAPLDRVFQVAIVLAVRDYQGPSLYLAALSLDGLKAPAHSCPHVWSLSHFQDYEDARKFLRGRIDHWLNLSNLETATLNPSKKVARILVVRQRRRSAIHGGNRAACPTDFDFSSIRHLHQDSDDVM